MEFTIFSGSINRNWELSKMLYYKEESQKFSEPYEKYGERFLAPLTK